jgi:predicted protein tyrosine phosphatase
MRYSQGYNDWATHAQSRGSSSDRERAQLTAAKIRDNHSGSAQDSRELSRVERIARGGGEDDDERSVHRQHVAVTAPKASKPAASKIKSMAFHLERTLIEISFHDDEWSVENIERMVSYAVGCRNDLDLTIHGFQGVSKLTSKTFKAQLKVSDYNADEDEDFNERVVEINGTFR